MIRATKICKHPDINHSIRAGTARAAIDDPTTGPREHVHRAVASESEPDVRAVDIENKYANACKEVKDLSAQLTNINHKILMAKRDGAAGRYLPVDQFAALEQERQRLVDRHARARDLCGSLRRNLRGSQGRVEREFVTLCSALLPEDVFKDLMEMAKSKARGDGAEPRFILVKHKI
jgi:hypothetical protein